MCFVYITVTLAQLVGLSKEVLLNTGADWMTSSSVSQEDIETEREIFQDWEWSRFWNYERVPSIPGTKMVPACASSPVLSHSECWIVPVSVMRDLTLGLLISLVKYLTPSLKGSYPQSQRISLSAFEGSQCKSWKQITSSRKRYLSASNNLTPCLQGSHCQ